MVAKGSIFSFFAAERVCLMQAARQFSHINYSGVKRFAGNQDNYYWYCSCFRYLQTISDWLFCGLFFFLLNAGSEEQIYDSLLWWCDVVEETISYNEVPYLFSLYILWPCESVEKWMEEKTHFSYLTRELKGAVSATPLLLFTSGGAFN